MSFDEYLAAQEANVAVTRALPAFQRLVLPVNDLYERGVRLIPPDCKPDLARMMLICHKSLLSSAALIVRCLPEDAAGVTRRAMETARMARAVKHDPENLKRWLNVEGRLARWDARNRGERPKDAKAGITYPANHPILEDLGRQLGMLSDAVVHFTPEFWGNLGWKTERTDTGGSVFLEYFTRDTEVITTHMALLAGVHFQSLQLFDECFDQAFSRDLEWVEIARAIVAAGVDLAIKSRAADAAGPAGNEEP